jgi:prophage antirepressor-like protein
MGALSRIFDYEGFAVRVAVIDGVEWFAGRDVCRCLEFVNHNQALLRLPDDERKGVCFTDPLGQNPQEFVAINEPGVYRLVFTSNKPEAERFRRWVFHEVLPSIRATGRYGPADALEPEQTQQCLALVREARLTLGRNAARALWLELGLPDVEDEGEKRGYSTPYDPIELFLTEACIITGYAAHTLSAPEISSAYAAWASRTGRPVLHAFTLRRRLPDYTRHSWPGEDGQLRPFWKAKSGTTVYRGIRLRPVTASAPAEPGESLL